MTLPPSQQEPSQGDLAAEEDQEPRVSRLGTVCWLLDRRRELRLQSVLARPAVCEVCAMCAWGSSCMRVCSPVCVGVCVRTSMQRYVCVCVRATLCVKGLCQSCTT